MHETVKQINIMNRYIIIIEQESDIIYPMVAGDEGLMAVFETINDARECAANNLMCQNYFYQIIDLDHTRAEF